MHQLRLCKTSDFSTATMVAPTVIVTLYVHCLSGYNRDEVCLLRGTDSVLLSIQVNLFAFKLCAV